MREESQNYNLQLDYDNGGALTGGVRMTRAKAEASMRHAYGEGDILSIDQGTLVTGLVALHLQVTVIMAKRLWATKVDVSHNTLKVFKISLC